MATFNTQFFNDFISFARFIVWIIKWCLTIRFWNTTSLLKIQKFLDILNFLFIVRTVVKHLLSQTLWSFFASAGAVSKVDSIRSKSKRETKERWNFQIQVFSRTWIRYSTALSSEQTSLFQLLGQSKVWFL